MAWWLVAGGGCWCGRGGRKLKITYIFTFQPNNVERQYSLRMNYYYYHHLHLLLLHPHSLTCTNVWPCLWGMDCGGSRWRSARQKKYYFAIIGQNLSRKINFPTGTALIPWAIDCAHQTAETAGAAGGGWLAAWLSQETTYTVDVCGGCRSLVQEIITLQNDLNYILNINKSISQGHSPLPLVVVVVVATTRIASRGHIHPCCWLSSSLVCLWTSGG